MSTLKTTKQQNYSWIRKLIEKLGRIGRTLMFPIAVLPIAAILLRIGAQIPTSTGFSKIMNLIIMNSGDIVFKNLHILFAIGLAFGFTKDQRGEAAFAGFIGIMLLGLLLQGENGLVQSIYGGINFGDEHTYIEQNTNIVLSPDGNSILYPTVSPKPNTIGALVLPTNLVDSTSGTRSINISNVNVNISEKLHLGFLGVFKGGFNNAVGASVLNGIIVGSLVAFIYNRIHNVKLPKILGFFAGRRLVPAFSILVILLFTICWAIVFPWIAFLIFLISNSMQKAATGNAFAKAGIMGAYGFFNRLLIPFGLHHIPNNLFWFQLGSFVDANGNTVNGDINIFLQGVSKNNPGGLFQAGFFPMMMFGLPALVAAFYYSAENKQQKIRIISIYGAAAVVSFVSGITEPIEFGFMFVSPLLYIIHSLLTGITGFITGLMGIQLGFGFSAGFMDYLLSIPKSLSIINESGFEGTKAIFANPFWVLALGVLTAILYFSISFFMIKKLNLNTPGRGNNLILLPEDNVKLSENSSSKSKSPISTKARMIYDAYGGKENITNYNNCSTRLRYEVKDGTQVSDEKLKAAGVVAIIRISNTNIQSIVGVEAESLNAEIINVKNEQE